MIPPLPVHQLPEFYKRKGGSASLQEKLLAQYEPSRKKSMWCRVCAQQFESKEELDEHRASLQHQKAVELDSATSSCAMCRKQFTSPLQLKEHKEGKMHKEREAKAEERRQELAAGRKAFGGGAGGRGSGSVSFGGAAQGRAEAREREAAKAEKRGKSHSKTSARDNRYPQEESAADESSRPRGGGGVCFDFQKGKCSRGDKCSFQHVLEGSDGGRGGGRGGGGGGGRGVGRAPVRGKGVPLGDRGDLSRARHGGAVGQATVAGAMAVVPKAPNARGDRGRGRERGRGGGGGCGRGLGRATAWKGNRG